MKMKKDKKIKAWIYLWPEDKKITNGQVMFSRIKKSTAWALFLREYPVEIRRLTDKPLDYRNPPNLKI